MNRIRPFAALVAVIALLFGQFAVAAHACSAKERGEKLEVIAHHESCEGMQAPEKDDPADNLCVEHCQYGKVSVENFHPFPIAAGEFGPALRLEMAPTTVAAHSRPSWRVAPLAAPPPPAILFGVLRI